MENETEKFWNVLSDKVVELAGADQTCTVDTKNILTDMLKKLMPIPSGNLPKEKLDYVMKLIDNFKAGMSVDEMKLLEKKE